MCIVSYGFYIVIFSIVSFIYYPFYSARLMSIATLADVLNSLCGALDFVSFLVRNFNREFFLNGHDDFDGVQAVETKVVGEGGVQGDLCKGVGEEIKTVHGESLVMYHYVGEQLDKKNDLEFKEFKDCHVDRYLHTLNYKSLNWILTLEGSILSKPLRISKIRDSTSERSRPAPAE
jgi:hypothetical protein